MREKFTIDPSSNNSKTENLKETPRPRETMNAEDLNTDKLTHCRTKQN